MKNESMIFEAHLLALRAHKGQVDKQGKPYIYHPVAVASNFKNADLQIVALLHDVVEDTEVSLHTLSLDFPNHIVDAIDAITHRNGELHEDYIKRCIKNKLAANVKKADIAHNLSRMDGIKDEETITRLKNKYAKAMDILKDINYD